MHDLKIMRYRFNQSCTIYPIKLTTMFKNNALIENLLNLFTGPKNKKPSNVFVRLDGRNEPFSLLLGLSTAFYQLQNQNTSENKRVN